MTLNVPVAPWEDSTGTVFILEKYGHCIRQFSYPNGIVSNTAGVCDNAGDGGDFGSATSALFINPLYIAVNTIGTLYLTDFGSRKVRMVTSNSIITTLLGTGEESDSGDGGPSTQATIVGPYGIWVNTIGQVFVDAFFSAIIRRVTTSMIVTTVVGSGSSGFSGDGGPATLAQLNSPNGVFADTNGQLYIPDSGNVRIRLVTNQGIISTIAGTGGNLFNGENVAATSVNFVNPTAIVVHTANGDMYIVDSEVYRVRVITATSQLINTLAGTGSNTYNGDGIASTSAGLNPTGIYLDTANNLFIGDAGNHRVRLVYSVAPTVAPSIVPTAIPSYSFVPTASPTISPTQSPTVTPSLVPTVVPTMKPTTVLPSSKPSRQPSSNPSHQPTVQPSSQPSSQPSGVPTCQPTSLPSKQPSAKPTGQPSRKPSRQPSGQPSSKPSFQPYSKPTSQPSVIPSNQPSTRPSNQPTRQPTSQPSRRPTCQPSCQPFKRPSGQPSNQPSLRPSSRPSGTPSNQPQSRPSSVPSRQPSAHPTNRPTVQPSEFPSSCPSLQPSTQPSNQPSRQPLNTPTRQPTKSPSSQPSFQPTKQPYSKPTCVPSISPSRNPSAQPTIQPNRHPTEQPSSQPSCQPFSCPTAQPSVVPSRQPNSLPTSQPSLQPARQPSSYPSSDPTSQPSFQPISRPSHQPTSQPTRVPTTQPYTSPTTTPTSLPSKVYHTPGSTLPSNSSISVIGLQLSGSFKIVLPFLPTLGVSSDSFAFSDIEVGSGAFGVAYLISGNDSSNLMSYSKVYGFDTTMRSVSLLRDINGDSYNDLIIGDPQNSKCYVLFGNSGGLTDMIQGFTIFGEFATDLTGWSVSDAGDVNNDTIHDIIVGAPFAKGTGVVYVIYGNTSFSDIYLNNLTSLQGFKVYGAVRMDYFGISVSYAGDVNKDGCDDVTIGALQTLYFYSGAAYIVYGGKNLHSIQIGQLSASQGCKFSGASSYMFTGFSVSGAGDVNKDGYDDVIIGTLPSKPSLQLTSYIIYGSSNLQNMMLSNMNVLQGTYVVGGGAVVSGFGDVNLDSYVDVIVGSIVDIVNYIGVIVYTSTKALVANSVKPTFAPSIGVTSIAPVVKPTRVPTLRPTLKPTLMPSTAAPSRAPVVNATESPTMTAYSAVPSVEPTVEPSDFPTVQPSMEPSEAPTLLPSVDPSKAPTVCPSNAPTGGPTTIVPVQFTPSRMPLSVPTNYPTIALSFSSIVNFVIDDRESLYNDSTSSHTINYLINATIDVILVPSFGKCIYVISPGASMTLTINRFNVSSDQIDLRLFSNIHRYSDLVIRAGSVIITLPTNQIIHIIDQEPAAITESNFIISKPSDVSATPKYVLIITVISIVIPLVGLLICACRWVAYRKKVQNDTKYKKTLFLIKFNHNINGDIEYDEDSVVPSNFTVKSGESLEDNDNVFVNDPTHAYWDHQNSYNYQWEGYPEEYQDYFSNEENYNNNYYSCVDHDDDELEYQDFEAYQHYNYHHNDDYIDWHSEEFQYGTFDDNKEYQNDEQFPFSSYNKEECHEDWYPNQYFEMNYQHDIEENYQGDDSQLYDDTPFY